jgi:hypothetical protein
VIFSILNLLNINIVSVKGTSFAAPILDFGTSGRQLRFSSPYFGSIPPKMYLYLHSAHGGNFLEYPYHRKDGIHPNTS